MMNKLRPSLIAFLFIEKQKRSKTWVIKRKRFNIYFFYH